MQRFALALTRFLALLVCFVLGFMSFAGILVGIGYVAYNHVSIDLLNKFGANIQTDELFDPDAEVPIDALTIKGIVEEIQLMATLGEEIDIDDLIERYGLTLDEETDKLIPEGLRHLPLATIFGQDGLYYVLDSVDVGYVLGFVPEGVLSDPLIYTLEDNTLADIVDMDLGYLFNGVQLGYLLDVTYEQDANGNYVMVQADPNAMTFNEIIAPIDMGNVLASAQEGNLDVLKVIDESLTDVTIAALLQSLDQEPLPEVFGDKTLGQLIAQDETGGYFVDINELAEGARLGEVMGYYYDDADESWYVDDGTTGDDRSEPAPIFEPLCNLFLTNLIEPDEGKTSADMLMGAYRDSGMKLGELMGYEYHEDDGKWYAEASDGTIEEADAFFAPICNALVADLIDSESGKTPSDAIMEQYELSGTKLGDMMGYYYDESDETWYIDDGKTGDEREKADALFAPLCEVMLYELINHPENKPAGEVIKDKFEEQNTRLGDLMGYSKEPNPDYDPEGEDTNEYIWYDSSNKQIVGIGAVIAAYTLTEVMDGGLDTDKIISDLTIAEVYGLERAENIPVYIEGTTTDISDKVKINLWYDEENNQASAIIGALAEYNVDQLDSEIDNLKIATVVDLVNYEGKYYSWKLVEDSNGDYVVLTHDDSITAEFADLDLKSLSDGGLETKIETVQIGKFLGYTKNSDNQWEDDNGVVTGIMGVVADAYTTNLGTKVNETTVGEIAGYYYKPGIGDQPGTWYVDEDMTVPATGIIGSLAGVTVEKMTDEDVLRENIQNIQIADVLGYKYDDDKKMWYEVVDGNEVYIEGIMAVIADSTVGNVDTVIDDTRIGEIAGYYYDPDTMHWYVDPEFTEEPHGVIVTMADLKVSELSDEHAVSEKVKHITIADAFGYKNVEGTWYETNPDGSTAGKVTGIMAVLADAQIGNISYTIETEQMGYLLGYHLGTKVDSHGNEIPWWYNGEVPVHVLMNKVSNTHFSDLDHFADELRLSDVIPEEDLSTGYLSLIDGDPTLEELPTCLNKTFAEKSLVELQDAGVIDPTLKIKDEFKHLTINEFLGLFAGE